MTVDFDAQFNELRKDYLFSLEDDIRDLETELVKEKITNDAIKEIFRNVHSIKGGAASHELPIISTICHHFEDFISGHLKSTDRNSETIDICLAYIDLLTKCSSEYKNEESPQTNDYLDKLASLSMTTGKSEKYKGRVLVVEGTSTMASIIKKGLNSTGYDCIVTKNGLSAFNIVITEKFDALITSLNLEQLDGVSVITAVKSTNNINSNIPTIVISASTNIIDRFPKEYKPTAIIEKNTNLLKNLTDTLEKMTYPSDIDNEEVIGAGPEKILYVEDDVRMQKLFTLAMKKHPHVKLEIASNMEEAIAKCKSFGPDLLLLDNFLDGCTGKDVFEKTIEYSIPAIFLTASEGSVDTKALKAHREYLGIITKPFRPGAIYGQICRFYNSN